MSKKKTHLPPLAQDMLYGLEMDVFEGDVGQALVAIWSAGVADQRIVDMIRYRVFKERYRQAFSRMPFRLPHLTKGKLVLGFDLQGRPIVIPVQYLNDHALVISGTGGGKTNRIRFVTLQIAPRLRGMWLFDLRKREFRALRPYLARLGINLVILPARQMRINPLQVPLGVDQLTTPVHVDHAVETPLAQARPAEDIVSGQRLPNQTADQDAANKLPPSLAPNILNQTESRAIAPQGNVRQAPSPDVHFCPQCGAKTNANDQEGHWLSYQGAKGESSSIQLIGQQLTIGKAPDCDLVIPDDDYLSRRHARLLQKEGKFF